MKKGWKQIFVFGNFVLFALSLLALVVISGAYALLTLPDVGVLETCFTTAMYEVRLCPGSGHYAKLKEISPYMLHAVIASEDGAFYSHKGFDWHEMKQSFDTDLATGQFHRGGSTLTQQLAKNVFLGKEKSLWRKGKEAYLAFAIENRYPKNFILEKYLNVVEFGENLYGVHDASHKYFKKAPSELTPLEAAWLAMLLPSPKKYSQSYRKGALTPYARKMVGVILKRMASFKKLPESSYQVALAHIDEFPWRNLNLAMFTGRPDYELESSGSAPTDEAPPPSEGDSEPDEGTEPHDLEN